MGSKTLCCALASVVALSMGTSAAVARQPPSMLGQSIAAFAAQPSLAPVRLPFRPRIGVAMGIVPHASVQDIATGSSIPVVYHGGPVMSQVTIHTIFWAPGGHQFDGSPAVGVASYEQLIQRFFADVAHDSATQSGVFSVLQQYRDAAGAGGYAISYDPTVDSIDDTDPYPPQSEQCPSPAGVATCVTDLELQNEIDHVISADDPGGRGLHDLWLIFLPPDVDTCVALNQCGTTVFAGYHAMSNLGSGPTIYAVIPDPLIEGDDARCGPRGQFRGRGGDRRRGARDDRSDDQSRGHRLDGPERIRGRRQVRAPQDGRPLGFASGRLAVQPADRRRPVSDPDDVVRRDLRVRPALDRRPSSSLPPATVDLRQFSSSVSGNIGTATDGVGVEILLGRAGTAIAGAETTTRANGSWGPVSLGSAVPRGGHTFGDDRDEILILYGERGPAPDLIETGDGGNPFTEAGWTGWFDLDHGYAVRPSSILLAPCGQTGILSLTINQAATAPPVEQCETETDVAQTQTVRLGAGTAIRMGSEDNRAVSSLNPDGALVTLTVPLGEPQSVSAVANSQIMFTPSGFPTCTADLRAQTGELRLIGPRARYALTRLRRHAVRRGRANSDGLVRISGFPGHVGVTAADVLELANGAGRALTVLHVAHLRVALHGEQTPIAGGTASPETIWGQPPATVPTSS